MAAALFSIEVVFFIFFSLFILCILMSPNGENYDPLGLLSYVNLSMFYVGSSSISGSGSGSSAYSTTHEHTCTFHSQLPPFAFKPRLKFILCSFFSYTFFVGWSEERENRGAVHSASQIATCTRQCGKTNKSR